MKYQKKKIKISFAIARKIITYLGVNLKNVKNLYTKNYKTLWKKLTQKHGKIVHVYELEDLK